MHGSYFKFDCNSLEKTDHLISALNNVKEIVAYITAVLLKSSKTPIMLYGRSIESLQEVSKTLQPFESVTRDICGEKYKTCRKIIPIVYNLLDDSNCHSDVAENLKLSLISCIKKRLKDVESNQIIAMAMILDPRFKKSCCRSALTSLTAIANINKK